MTVTARAPVRVGSPAQQSRPFTQVGDTVAAAAILLGLALPWDHLTRGTDWGLGLAASLLALAALVAPHLRRADLLPACLGQSDRRIRWLGLLPLLAMIGWRLAADVLQGAGVGAGLALALAGALLGAWIDWRYAPVIAAGGLAVCAVAAPILQVRSGAGWGPSALTAAMLLFLLWNTVWQHSRGDDAAGLLLVGFGAAVALGMALLGGNTWLPWVDSLHQGRIGLLLLPAIAACAVPQVWTRCLTPGRGTPSEARERWHALATRALDLGWALGAFLALSSVLSLVIGPFRMTELVRVLLNAAIAAVACLAYQALKKSLENGYHSAIVAAVIIGGLGLLTAEVTTSGYAGLAVQFGATAPLATFQVLAGLGLPGVVLVSLLAPHSVRPRQAQLPAAAEPQEAQVNPETAANTFRPAAYPQWARPEEASVDRPTPPRTETIAADTQLVARAADLSGPRWTPQQAVDPDTPLADLAQISAEAPHLRPLVAANPATYPDLLDWLGQLGDPDVDAALQARRALRLARVG